MAEPQRLAPGEVPTPEPVPPVGDPGKPAPPPPAPPTPTDQPSPVPIREPGTKVPESV